ncbi:MAG: pantoate--beta-alanine ligase [Steroidobacteraceae bacterium]|nr:pantoate--beta-alanine ligase [Steroidobacteraceae bacterium]
MKPYRSIADWHALRDALGDRTLGLVPTMGALHPGHLSLVQRSQRENAVTVVSIFVNPTQFDQPDDLDRYPRQTEDDLALLRDAAVDAVFLPTREEIYPDAYLYRVCESELSRKLCGAHRPGHFDGMLTVVMKLLNIVQPTRAYFGEKDYQQLLLVRGMAQAFFMDVDIVACPVVREPDGLAMSSRNQNLDAAQRRLAPSLHQVLRESKDTESAQARLQQLGFDVDYVEDFKGRRLAAVRLGGTRLIDNVGIELPGHAS